MNVLWFLKNNHWDSDQEGPQLTVNLLSFAAHFNSKSKKIDLSLATFLTVFLKFWHQLILTVLVLKMFLLNAKKKYKGVLFNVQFNLL